MQLTPTNFKELVGTFAGQLSGIFARYLLTCRSIFEVLLVVFLAGVRKFIFSFQDQITQTAHLGVRLRLASVHELNLEYHIRRN